MTWINIANFMVVGLLYFQPEIEAHCSSSIRHNFLWCAMCKFHRYTVSVSNWVKSMLNERPSVKIMSFVSRLQPLIHEICNSCVCISTRDAFWVLDLLIQNELFLVKCLKFWMIWTTCHLHCIYWANIWLLYLQLLDMHEHLKYSVIYNVKNCACIKSNARKEEFSGIAFLCLIFY